MGKTQQETGSIQSVEILANLANSGWRGSSAG